MKEQLAQTLAAFVVSILTGPRRRSTSESAEEPPLGQIIDMLQQVMCTHDAGKLAISVLEIYRVARTEIIEENAATRRLYEPVI